MSTTNPASASPSTTELTKQPWQGNLFSKLKWLMFFRLILATSLFVSAVAVQIREAPLDGYSHLLYVLIIALYLLSAIYAAIIKRVGNLTVFAYIQFFFDALLITPLIYATGGLESIFSFLYFLNIISASYLLYTPGAFFAATLSGIFYGALISLQAAKIIPHYQGVTHAPSNISYVFYNITINIFAFYLVAFLSSYLAEQLKRTKEALLEEQLNLRELEEVNRKIVENIKAGIITMDHVGRITFMNSAAQQLTDQRLDDVLGTNIDQLFPATTEYLEDIQLDDESILRPTRWERHYTTKVKQRLFLGFSTSPLRDPDGQEVGKMLFFEDLTRIKYLEDKARQDDRLKSIGRLAAGIAHEIRNPLASISGATQVLYQDLDLRDEDKELMNIVVRETDRLNGLITDFLNYVRQAPLDRQLVHLEEMCNEVLEAIRHDPKCTDAIIFSTRFEHQSQLEADPAQLRQVLWNLVLNAAEVMPDGGQLSLSTRDVPGLQIDQSGRVEIVVADSGPGIEPSIENNIFDPFFSTKAGGTGLGLALVQKIVQTHDGLVRVRPGPLGGTAFEVTLPAVILPESEETSSSVPENNDDSNRRTVTHVG